MAVVHNTKVTASGLARLLSQFQGKPRLTALLSAFLDECQEVEDALYDVYYQRALQNGVAVGDLLAKLGKIVGQGSEGLSDAIYRTLIQARIAANRSRGTKPDLLNMLTLLIPSTVIEAWTMPPASFYVEPLGPISFSPYLIVNSFLRMAISAGVAVSFVWTQVARSTTILGGSVYNPSFSAGPPPTNTGVTANQSLGSVHSASFAAGPPVTNAGGGVLAGVVEVLTGGS